MRTRMLVIVISAIAVSGCLNAEREKYPLDWSRKSTLTDLHDIEGTYANISTTVEKHSVIDPQERLWYFLTKQESGDSKGVHVRLSITNDDTLTVELLNTTGVTIKTACLKQGRGYAWKKDSLQLSPESGFAYDALGGGFGTGTCRLRRAENGGLVGEIDGIAAGLFLHFIPTVGVGNDWYFWPKIE